MSGVTWSVLLSLVGCPTPADSEASVEESDDTAAVDADADGWAAALDCDDADAAWHPEEIAPSLPSDKCVLGEGVGVSMSSGSWTVVAAEGAEVSLADGDSDCGDTLVFDYALDGPSTDGSCCWAVMEAPLAEPTDLSSGYLALPFRAAAEGTDFAVELKLVDAAGCAGLVRFEEAADLPAWRPALMSPRQLDRPGGGQGGCTADLSQVEAVQVAVSSPDGPDAGTLWVGELRHIPGATLRASELEHYACIENDQQAWKDALPLAWAEQVQDNVVTLGHGVHASWDAEEPARYYLYTQALSLIVLARAEQTEAATAMAEALATGLATRADGTWPDYWSSTSLDIDTNDSTWVGNLAWGILGLDAFLDAVAPEDDGAFVAAIGVQADALVAAQAAAGLDGLLTSGTEGNVSAWFALVAAARHTGDADHAAAASALATALLETAWDDDEQRFWMGTTDANLAEDVVGGWGARFLAAQGLHDEARAGLALSAGVFAVRSWDDSVLGLGDIAGPWQPTVEFTAQHIAAGGPGSQVLLDSLFELERDGLNFPGSPDDFVGGASWNTSWTGVSPSAWVWLALDGGVLGP